MNAPGRAARRGSLISLLVVITAMAAIVIASLQLETVKLRMLPLSVAVAVLLFAALRMVLELRSAPPAPAHPPREAGVAAMSLPAVTLWLGGFFLAIYLLGFIVAIPLFLVAYMRALGVAPRTILALAAGVTGFIYVMFERLLAVGLHGGLLFS